MLARAFLVCLVSTRALAEPALVQFTRVDDAYAGWKAHATRDGITLEKRSVPGSRFHEYRAVADLPVDADAAAEDVWRALRDGDMETLKHREILRESADQLIIYDQIKTPIVNDRDYVIEVRRLRDATLRRTEFRCATVDGVGPPAASGHVRIPIIRAGWLVEPGARGGTRLTYYAYSEPGGLITALLARGAQANRSMADILHMAKRLRRLSK